MSSETMSVATLMREDHCNYLENKTKTLHFRTIFFSDESCFNLVAYVTCQAGICSAENNYGKCSKHIYTLAQNVNLPVNGNKNNSFVWLLFSDACNSLLTPNGPQHKHFLLFHLCQSVILIQDFEITSHPTSSRLGVPGSKIVGLLRSDPFSL